MNTASIADFGRGNASRMDVDRSADKAEQAALNSQYRMNRNFELTSLQQEQNSRVALHSNQTNAMKGLADKVQL